MRAGALRHRVTLLQPTQTRGSTFGDVQKSFASAGQVWAAMEPLRGRELLAAQQLNSEARVRFRVRRSSVTAPVTATWRVDWGGRIFDIVEPPVDPDGRGVELRLICAEVRVG